LQVVAILLAMGADVNAKTDYYSNAPLHSAVQSQLGDTTVRDYPITLLVTTNAGSAATEHVYLSFRLA
jgi:hypothetical protein